MAKVATSENTPGSRLSVCVMVESASLNSPSYVFSWQMFATFASVSLIGVYL